MSWFQQGGDGSTCYPVYGFGIVDGLERYLVYGLGWWMDREGAWSMVQCVDSLA
jgi:hypothetical protein